MCSARSVQCSKLETAQNSEACKVHQVHRQVHAKDHINKWNRRTSAASASTSEDHHIMLLFRQGTNWPQSPPGLLASAQAVQLLALHQHQLARLLAGGLEAVGAGAALLQRHEPVALERRRQVLAVAILAFRSAAAVASLAILAGGLRAPGSLGWLAAAASNGAAHGERE